MPGGGRGGVLGGFRVMAVVVMTAALLSGCASAGVSREAIAADMMPAPTALDGLIAKYAALDEVPEALIRRIIVRESGYNPRAHNGPYWGLMQIRYDTAQTMGYRGPAAGLLDAETNLSIGVKYLRGAWLLSGGDQNRAVGLYAGGYYYVARARGMLAQVGLE